MSTQKHIAVIGLKGLPAFGGAATVGQNIIGQLNNSYQFTVFAVSSHARDEFEMENVHQVIFKTFPIKFLNIFFYYIKSCLAVFFSRKYDLVHLHHTDGAFILPLLRLRYKVVLTSHARPQDNSKWSATVKVFFKCNEWLAIRFSSVFTTVSEPLKKLYEQKYHTNVVYIPNGVDIQLGRALNKKHEYPKPYLLFAAGRIIPLKGLHLLLQALKEIGFEGRLVVAGNLDQMPSYRKKILEMSKGLDVDFAGLIKEKNTLLTLVKGAFLFVFPSLTEAMSIMLLETALVKTPILCSDIDANKAVFNEDEVIFFQSDNTGDLVDQLKKVLDAPALLNKKAEKAYDKLNKYYRWDKIAVEYKKVFELIS